MTSFSQIYFTIAQPLTVVTRSLLQHVDVLAIFDFCNCGTEKSVVKCLYTYAILITVLVASRFVV